MGITYGARCHLFQFLWTNNMSADHKRISQRCDGEVVCGASISHVLKVTVVFRILSLGIQTLSDSPIHFDGTTASWAETILQLASQPISKTMNHFRSLLLLVKCHHSGHRFRSQRLSKRNTKGFEFFS